MSIGRTFEESFLKAVRSLEMKVDHIYKAEFASMDQMQLLEKIKTAMMSVSLRLPNGYVMDLICPSS